MNFADFFDFIISPVFSGWLLILKIIFIGFSLFFLIFILIALIKTTWLRKIILEDLFEFLTYRPYETRKAMKAWSKITKRLKTKRESEYKLALIEADSMLDNVLKNLGYKGENLKERLKLVSAETVSNIEKLLEAHEICGHIINDPDYRLTLEETEKVLNIYHQALKDLQVL
ncbi:MAG: hypothetical protein QME61_02390 [Patescibacteria group bacterium]|nr:hypothetical protein [Patescibacteria group bacterium]